jgi:hypothetical protein
MAHKKKSGAPVPPANRPKVGPAGPPQQTELPATEGGETAPPQAQDPKRRPGDFTGAGEHARQQPAPLNDGTQHSR